MQTFNADIAIIGAGGAGLRAAIAAAEANPNLNIALISKVYPMRSHTVAAEGGSAAVTQDHDSFDFHFQDTVSGGDWLCEQDVVDHFVHQCPTEMAQLELWGCPWSRKDDGSVNVRRFGGMKIERTWFAADKTGFHMLHTLFQTSLKYPQIKRFDEHFVLDILVDEGQVRGVVAINMMEGTRVQIRANAVVMATGGAGRVYRYNTNGGIVTGDGMGMAFRHGIPLRDMEFVQYHPTGLPGSGILMTEGCRGEGGILVNKDGYRYLQDYGMGPETPLGEPKNKYMELGPRDKVSQAFWHEWRAGRTIETPRGDVVYLDLRHLGEKKLRERLPFICELAKAYVGVDPITDPIPVRPTAHYTMGGIETDAQCETRIKGLFAVGECSSVGLHGANRLGSNSLAELVVFGRMAGEKAAERAVQAKDTGNNDALDAQVRDIENRIAALMAQEGDESWAAIRDEMGLAMEEGCGIYRTTELMQKTINKLAELKERFKRVKIQDTSSVFNTDLLYTIELGHGLEVAECMAHSALHRRESRGAHQRLDEGCTERDDVNFLKHTLAFYQPDSAPRLEYGDVKITTLPPAKRVYGGESETHDKKDKEQSRG
ncbi:fumarate reductase (quinol) flavoprotein subunit [Rahnella sp. C60]|uniref:Fumarate reductase flavoprotein subunit n=1 Tax=Rahnella perminowiae TaxID=2816244 RepID=A0ABS6L0M8_9GAMM|nr:MULTISPECIES: fumarate reductase (quinol) flavoprotein subunit [Rahnella]UJD87752.1 fumarate reductase (quinol) flavoprotein subunit [Rahnella aquatilis]MBU9812338.1 fumarate reductase (quinol) flavoprotein subunit [Rahnella perminowiae]MBU9814847.1 fumarate reductase (quinol) flavoprotein subunit [Rahnella perminowiae]MBU9827069.1 fumarate reductase (quinol) flavoprotein subunit [Rahnella perminowiae]MBU9835271.1 fumarate reductase (quinol) flavoprotein subunit [Rahnella perminowiae]